MSSNPNPGNFANRPKEEVAEIGRKGGLASGGSADTEEYESSSGTANTNPGNFANRPREEVAEIGRKGGLSSGGSAEVVSFPYLSNTETPQYDENDQTSGTANTNPGNFANRPKEEVSEIARKGGQASHSGGFASMDPDKQREIASMGGKASHGGSSE